MMERHRPRAAAAGAQGKIKHLEERVARLEAELKRVRGEGARSSGAARARLAEIEKTVTAQIARAQATLKDSASRLSRALADVKKRREVTRQIARAQVTVRESLERLGRALAGSRQTLQREVGLLGRGLRAGVKAGSAAYRRRRG